MLSLVVCQSQNTFVAIVDLPEGEHQYKFYVDGQWTHDPAEVSNYSHKLFDRLALTLEYMLQL